jgi:dTDP-4-amino-4,6-dideoxygalactose transaminase
MSQKYIYNSWPLGKLPIEWQRPEPQIIRELGYQWDDPRDIVDLFEEKLAKFAGSRYAVATDTCSNALFLCLKFRNYTESISIPRQTYASVPMQVLHSGAPLEFRSESWEGIYELQPTNIFDSAARFAKGMYVGNDALQVLSFQIKKRLPIGKGGAILTDSREAYDWLKLASYDGRNLKTPYDSENHVSLVGWHFYMTPEDAARGILLMDQLPVNLPDCMTFENYPDLSKMKLFAEIPLDE